jgi:outer membrane lipoprotein-sorting protein
MTGARALAPVALLAMTAAGPAMPSIAWVDVSAAYAQVHDYTCLYRKEERAISNGDLQRIRLSFRKPLDVKLEWLNGDGRVDQIAVYRRGMNNGKVLARRTGGVASWLGTLKLDPTSSRALEDSRHPITDVGIGYIVGSVSQEIARNGDSGAAAETMLDDKPAYRFELDARGGAALLGVDGARHATIWVDRDSKLPVDVEIRDGAGGLIERHRFSEIRINPGLTDQTFTL